MDSSFHFQSLPVSKPHACSSHIIVKYPSSSTNLVRRECHYPSPTTPKPLNDSTQSSNELLRSSVHVSIMNLSPSSSPSLLFSNHDRDLLGNTHSMITRAKNNIHKLEQKLPCFQRPTYPKSIVKSIWRLKELERWF